MYPYAPTGDIRPHYRLQLVIEGKDVQEIRGDAEFDEYHTRTSYMPIVRERDSHYTVTASKITFRELPGEKLQELIDLGYTEEQGVAMLDVLEAT